MRSSHRSFLLEPAFVLLVSLIVTAAAGWQLWLAAEARAGERLAREAVHVRDRVVGRVEASVAVLASVSRLVAATRRMNADELRAFIAPLDVRRHAPGLQAIGLTRQVSAADREELVRTLRAEGAPDFDIRPEAERDEFQPVVAVEAVAGDPRIGVGDDLYSDPVRRAVMAQARDTGAAALSAKLALSGAPGEPARPGIFIYVPMYRDGRVPETVDERRATLLGFVFAPARVDELLAGIVDGGAPAAANFALFDGAPEVPANLLVGFPAAASGNAAPADFVTRGVVEVGGRKWLLAAADQPAFERLLQSPLVLAVLAGGGLLGLLLTAALRARAGAQSLAERFADGLGRAQFDANEQRRVFRAAFAGVGDAVITTDHAGRVRELNAAAQALTGWTLDEAAGTPVDRIFAIVDEQTRQLVASPAARAAGGEQLVPLPDHSALIARDGSERPIEGGVATLGDDRGRRTGMVLVFRDIGERRRAEKALRLSGERFHFLAEVLPQKIFTARPDGEVDYFNRQWTEFTGLSFDEIKGWGWQQFIHPDDLDEHLRRWRQALASGEPFLFEHRIRRADGSYRWHLSRAHAMRDGQDKVVAWIGSNTDVDDLKRAEQERAEMLDSERFLRAQAEAANRAKDEFLATLSHELRTPLNAILGWTQTLLKGSTRKDTLLRALTQIEHSAKAQARLVDDLLNVSDIVAGRLRLEVQPIRLSAAIEAAVESLRPAIDAKGITFTSALDPAADAINADAVRLQQVVWNLLANAVKFTPRGGAVRLTLTRTGQGVEIAVADSGEGISADFLPYVFKRFRQADASSKRRHGGLGLGLAIVRHLVELHGGTVAAESAGLGQGACFTVCLPVAAPRPQAPPAPPPLPVAAVAPETVARRRRLTGLRILSVDDDGNTREMLQEALERAGAEVLSAASASEALAALPRFRPDVLVSDIGLPEQDGLSLLRQIRALPPEQGGTTPAVALTGYAREQDRSASLQAGYQAFTPKPVDLDELFALINRVAKRAP